MKRSQNFVRRLARDQSGSITVTFVLTFSVMLAGSLFAIDMVRYNVAETRLQNALDTAVISAGRKLADYKPSQTGGQSSGPGDAWKNDAYAYFRANMPTDFLAVQIPDQKLSIQYYEDRVGDNQQFLSAQRIHMSASGDLPLLSTGFLSQTSMPLQASNEAIRRVRNDLELVLALDNTGSMADSKKMTMLKSSAKGLIDTVMAAAAAGGQTDGLSGAYIGLVPFTDSVNVGGIATAKSWLTYPPALQSYIDNVWSNGAAWTSSTSQWSGCIVEPNGNWTSAKALPAAVLSPSAGFQPLLSTYSSSYTPSKVGYGYLVADSRYTANGGPGFAFNAPGTGTDRRIGASPSKSWSSTPSSAPTAFNINLAQESQYCTRSRVLFLSQNQTTLENSVAAMQSYGGTGIPAGLLWAWRMLSPAWRGAAGWGDADRPRDGSPKLRKVIVLLSDGDNAPVVERASDSASSARLYKLSYSYVPCTKTQTSGKSTTCKTYGSTTQVTDEVITDSLSSFSQCPINGLKIVDPLSVTPGNYTQHCSSNLAGSDIGYPYTPGRGSSDNFTGGGRLTSAATDNYMNTLCANIKKDSNNILIYTLTLGTDVSSTAKSVMQNCASSTDTYYDVRNANDLPDVFAEIAGALTELRLIQ